MPSKRSFQTFQELADKVGWHRNSLRERLRRPGCPVKSRGPWTARDVSKLLTWFGGLRAPEIPVGRVSALEDYRRERFELARMDRQERAGQLVNVEEVRSCARRVAAVFRNVAETLQRHGNREACQLIEEAVSTLETEFAI